MAAVLLGGCTLIPATRSEQSGRADANAHSYGSNRRQANLYRSTRRRGQDGDLLRAHLAGEGRALYFRTDGRIRSVYFKRNETGAEGDVIAEYEIDALDRVTASELELERAQVTLDEAIRNLDFDRREAQPRLERARIALEGVDADRQARAPKWPRCKKTWSWRNWRSIA